MKGIKCAYGVFCKDDKHYLEADAALIYDEDTVIDAGKYSELKPKYPNVEFKDLGNVLIAPGFVDLDALGDIDHTLIDLDFSNERPNDLRWSKAWFDRRHEQLSPEDEAFKSLYAYAQLIRHGITTAMPITSVVGKATGETYEEIDAAAENAIKLGLRVYLGPSYLMKKPVIVNGEQILLDVTPEEQEAGLVNAEKFILKWKDKSPLVNPVVVPERIEQQTEELLIASKELARKYDIPIRLHAAQGAFEYRVIKERTKLSPIQYLDSIGFLDDKTFIPHGLYMGTTKFLPDDMTTTDMDIVRDRGVTIIHCPLVYARFGIALDSFGKYSDYGINMSMGTDCFPPDLFENIRIGNFYAQYIEGTKESNCLAAFYNAATIGGADALGRSDLGRLRAGTKADLIVMPLNNFSLGVMDDPFKTLILTATGNHVRDVMINGRWVMKDRQISGIDFEELRVRAEDYYEKMRLAYVERSEHPKLSVDEYYQSFLR